MMPRTTALDVIRSLVSDFGYDEVIEALLEETRSAPAEQLDAVATLLDAVLVTMLAEGDGGADLQRAILQ